MHPCYIKNSHILFLLLLLLIALLNTIFSPKKTQLQLHYVQKKCKKKIIKKAKQKKNITSLTERKRFEFYFRKNPSSKKLNITYSTKVDKTKREVKETRKNIYIFFLVVHVLCCFLHWSIYQHISIMTRILTARISTFFSELR